MCFANDQQYRHMSTHIYYSVVLTLSEIRFVRGVLLMLLELNRELSIIESKTIDIIILNVGGNLSKLNAFKASIWKGHTSTKRFLSIKHNPIIVISLFNLHYMENIKTEIISYYHFFLSTKIINIAFYLINYTIISTKISNTWVLVQTIITSLAKSLQFRFGIHLKEIKLSKITRLAYSPASRPKLAPSLLAII